MNFVFSVLLYGILGLALAMGGIGILNNTALWCSIMVCVLLIDCLSFLDGIKRNSVDKIL